jgi:hypothetical protein
MVHTDFGIKMSSASFFYSKEQLHYISSWDFEKVVMKKPPGRWFSI